MAQKTKLQLKAANTAIDTNGVQAITGSIHHNMNEDLIDSLPTYDDDANRLRQVEAKSAVDVTSGGTRTITFDNTIGTAGTSYALYINCYDTLGNNVDFQCPLSLRTSALFKITVPITCKMDYIATEI